MSDRRQEIARLMANVDAEEDLTGGLYEGGLLISEAIAAGEFSEPRYVVLRALAKKGDAAVRFAFCCWHLACKQDSLGIEFPRPWKQPDYALPQQMLNMPPRDVVANLRAAVAELIANGNANGANDDGIFLISDDQKAQLDRIGVDLVYRLASDRRKDNTDADIARKYLGEKGHDKNLARPKLNLVDKWRREKKHSVPARTDWNRNHGD